MKMKKDKNRVCPVELAGSLNHTREADFSVEQGFKLSMGRFAVLTAYA